MANNVPDLFRQDPIAYWRARGDVRDAGPTLIDGEKRVVRLPSYAVCVVRVSGSTYAIEDACNHGAASLAEGTLRDCQLICPRHKIAFDVRTGDPVGTPRICDAQRVFDVFEHDGRVFFVTPHV